jgi:hypothetical protein
MPQCGQGTELFRHSLGCSDSALCEDASSRGRSAIQDHAVVQIRLLAARLWVTKMAMKPIGRVLLWLTLFAPVFAFAQIDPVKRDLIQLGYNQAFEGHAPFAGYAFYYHNQPDFLRTNLTLRLALAPVYLDSEFGFVHGLGPNTDFAIGLAGGGLRTVTTKSTAAPFSRRNRLTGTAAKFPPAFIICSIPPT